MLTHGWAVSHHIFIWGLASVDNLVCNAKECTTHRNSA